MGVVLKVVGAFALESGVPVVFDGVVGATIEQSGNGGPFVPESGVGPDNGVVFIGSEGAVLDLRRKLVAPPQSARLAGSTRDGLTDERPIPGAIVLYEAAQQLVLVGTPGTLYPVDNIIISGSHKWKEAVKLANP